MAFTTATLTGTYLTGDGQPASGVIEIIPNYRALIDAEGDVILSGRIKVTLDETGSFSATLPSTDDETVEPATGRQYTVSAKLRHQHLPAVTGIELAAGEEVDMADVTSAVETTATLSTWLTQEEYEAALAAKANAADLAGKADAADVTALDTRIDALEAAPGGVSSVNGEAGDVTLTAADVGADPVFTPQAFGIVDTTGATDCSTAVLAALQAAYDAGGGTIYFPPGTYRIDSRLAIPNDGAFMPKQPPITLRGAGSRFDGKWQILGAMPGGSVLDLRSTAAPAKLDTRGLGVLVIEDLGFAQNGSAADATPFIQTTNTTLKIRGCSFFGHTSLTKTACVTDAIVLGASTTASDGSATSMFQGYGTVIEANYFARCRRVVWGRSACNSVSVVSNTISNTCGATSSEACVHFDGTIDQATGNYIVANVFETTGYPYVIRLTNSGRNYCAGNAFWDDDPAVLLACHYLDGSNTKTDRNYIQGIFTSLSTQAAKRVVNPSNSFYSLISNGDFVVDTLKAQQTTVQPADATGVETSVLFAVKRSASEATNPAQFAASVRQDGRVFIGGSWSSGANLGITNGTATTTTDHTSIVKNTGHLDLYGGTGAADMVRIQRGALKIKTTTTAARPSASGTGAGAMLFDTNLNKPIWSNGTAWVDATGATV